MPVTSDQRCSWAPPLLLVARISTTLIRRGPASGPRGAGVKHGASDGPPRPPAVAPRAPSGIGSIDEDALDGLVDGAPLVLVGLVAAQEVELPAPGGDRLLDVAGDHHDARREVAGVRVHAGVVVRDALAVVEMNATRHEPVPDREPCELQGTVRPEMTE